MKLNAFEKLIRKVVREEIDYALRREIKSLKEELTPKNTQQLSEAPDNQKEVENFRAQLKAQMPPPTFNTGNNTLNNLLAETAMTPSPEEMFDANDPVNQFINKDYSQIMSAIDNKKQFRP